MGFSREEYGVGYHALLQGIFLTQESNLHLSHWQAVFLTTSTTWEAPLSKATATITDAATLESLLPVVTQLHTSQQQSREYTQQNMQAGLYVDL